MSHAQQTYYYLETDNKHASLALSINDVLIHCDRWSRNSMKRNILNEWIHKGKNEFQVNITVPPGMDTLPDDFGCSFKITEYIKTGDDMQQNIIATVDWNHKEGDVFPVIIDTPFETSVASEGWYWYDADVFTEENIPREKLNGIVKKLYTVLDKKDWGALEPLLNVKATEMAAAMNIPLQERFSDQKKFFMNLFADSGWGMVEPDYDGYLVYRHSGGRLLELMDKQGKPILHSKAIGGGGDSKFMLSLYLARKNGEWLLCR